MRRTAKVWLVNVSRAANIDIQEIHRWTRQRFGAEQADAYAAAIGEAISTLVAGPTTRGVRRRKDIQNGLYTLHLGRTRRRARHLILFRIRDTDLRVLDVLRVLHEAMDLARHVPRDDPDPEGGGR